MYAGTIAIETSVRCLTASAFGLLASSTDLCEDVSDYAVAADGVEREAAAGLAAGVGGQGAAEGGAGAVEADAGVFFRDTERLGGFGGAHTFDIAEHEDDAVTVGQSFDALFEHAAEFGRSGGLIGVGGW